HDDTAPACESHGEGLSRSEEISVASIDLTGLLTGRTTNPVVRPGDFINIPEADQIFVVGNVVRPSAFPLTQRLTVSRAIAMAGGRQSGSKDYVRIIRQNPGSSDHTELRLEVKAIEQHDSADIELQPGDVVEVPISQGKTLAKTVLMSI